MNWALVPEFQLRMLVTKKNPLAIEEHKRRQELVEIRVTAARDCWGYGTKKTILGEGFANVTPFRKPSTPEEPCP